MYGDNPFGNPDGARADLSEIENMFILETPYAVDFSLHPEVLLTKRVIVGAKGSGKTIYLRKMCAMLKGKENSGTGIYVDDTIDQNLNCTEQVVRICEFYNERVLSEKWTQFWKVAIYVSLACKLLNDQKLTASLTNEQKDELEKILCKHNLYFDICISVYKAFYAMASIADTKNKCDTLIDITGWLKLEDILTKVLKTSPTIYLFLDSIDIEYEHAPMHWNVCQKGLFYVVMDMLQDKEFGERLHIVMAMRNNVFASVLRSEHGSKYLNESHVFCLEWSFDNIKRFLISKIEKLNECYFINEDLAKEKKTIKAWLGIEKIYNPNRNVEENVLNYIVRHTRLVPRDVVIICNKLAKAKRDSLIDENFDIQKFTHDIVFEECISFGDELITICAKNIIANMLPQNAGRYNYSDGFIASEPYRRGNYQKLKEVMKDFPSDRFSLEELKKVEESANRIFGTDSFLSDVLWQNGVIGYIDQGGFARYFTQKAVVDQTLPIKAAYIMRTCIAACLDLEKVYANPENIK